jgi:predicted nuclease with TOPRIM domain
VFQRLNGELRTENSCMRADLENACKELSVLKGEIVKHEENYRSKNAFINKVLTENEELKIKIEKFESFFHG